ncbi:hypothetical protein F4861DRAFT_481036 [Xylaria intraflava]|nr:hypothetical protein F4861DRAFT_481036 [Xylaria intraflava]
MAVQSEPYQLAYKASAEVVAPNLPLTLLQYQVYGCVSLLPIGPGRSTAEPSPRICHIITPIIETEPHENFPLRTLSLATGRVRTDSLGPGNKMPQDESSSVRDGGNTQTESHGWIWHLEPPQANTYSGHT